jgi:hypothetical protein
MMMFTYPNQQKELLPSTPSGIDEDYASCYAASHFKALQSKVSNIWAPIGVQDFLVRAAAVRQDFERIGLWKTPNGSW